jgi:hypothetical protein
MTILSRKGRGLFGMNDNRGLEGNCMLICTNRLGLVAARVNLVQEFHSSVQSSGIQARSQLADTREAFDWLFSFEDAPASVSVSAQGSIVKPGNTSQRGVVDSDIARRA